MPSDKPRVAVPSPRPVAVREIQLIDRTKGREKSFFGQGVVGHVAFAEPYCPAMRESIIQVIEKHSSSTVFE